MTTLFEVCCTTIESAQSALADGAHRVELCSNLESGGLTPIWLTRLRDDSTLRKNLQPRQHSMGQGVDFLNPTNLQNKTFLDRSHVLIRCRPGNFIYTQAEVDAMCASIRLCRQARVKGVVIGALDYMVATPLTVARGGAVNLTFNHVFAMIEFQIKGSGNLTQVSLNGADPLACAGTIDLTQTPGDGAYTVTTSSTSKYVTVTLGTAAPLSSETATSVYMMILPGEQSENLQIALKIDGNWKEMSKTQPTGGFVRGKKYVVELNTGGMSANVLTDSRDENTYSYKTIGTQVWMTENLAYLPSVVGPGTGSNSTAYYYVYGYDGTDVDAAKATSNYTTYGVLYNWPAAMSGAASSSADPSGVQGICPTGWHLPSHAEWTTLTTYLGGESVAGGKMKEAGESHWTNPNTGATNESGFTALPGGYRYNYGKFDVIGILGSWWSSTEFSTGYAWYRSLYYYSSHVGRYYANKANGFSVRCLRD
jgi:uncharacterized protein (TIGR02145 family)